MLLLTKFQTLFGVHQFSTNVLFLFQYPILATILLLAVVSPHPPLIHDSFSEYAFTEFFLYLFLKTKLKKLEYS